MESMGFAHWLVVLVETFALLFVLVLVIAVLVVLVVWVHRPQPDAQLGIAQFPGDRALPLLVPASG